MGNLTIIRNVNVNPVYILYDITDDRLVRKIDHPEDDYITPVIIYTTTDIIHIPVPPPFANSLARLRSRSALVGLGGGTGFKAIILRWCVERSLLAPKTDRPPPPPAKWLMLRADDSSRGPPPPTPQPPYAAAPAAAPSSRVIELALPGDRRDELADPGRLHGVRSRGDKMVGIRSVLRLAAFRSALPSPPSKHIYVTHVQTRTITINHHRRRGACHRTTVIKMHKINYSIMYIYNT